MLAAATSSRPAVTRRAYECGGVDTDVESIATDAGDPSGDAQCGNSSPTKRATSSSNSSPTQRADPSGHRRERGTALRGDVPRGVKERTMPIGLQNVVPLCEEVETFDVSAHISLDFLSVFLF